MRDSFRRKVEVGRKGPSMIENTEMAVPLRVEDYLLDAPAIDFGVALADASSKFAAERSRIVKQRERFDELCRLAEIEATPDQLVGIAAHLNDFEKQLAAVLVPVISRAEKV